MAQLPTSKLTLTSDLTEDDFVSVKSAFANQQHWNEKNIVGNSDQNAERTRCIRVVKNKRFRGLLPYQAAWWITNGPFDTDKWTISHICTSETSGGCSRCVNVKHMRLETLDMNLNKRRPHQIDLRKFWDKKKFSWPKFNKQPLFLETIGMEANCDHNDNGRKDDDEDDVGYPGYPCFMNIRTINIKGHYWCEEPQWTGPKSIPKVADNDGDE